MTTDRDEKFMRAALVEAKKALGRTSPNPAVGAVLVIDNRIVSKGHHREAGRAHAEIECLRDFGAPIPARATLYVTLEPCSTAGRTAPCTDAIIKAGLKKRSHRRDRPESAALRQRHCRIAKRRRPSAGWDFGRRVHAA